MKPSACASLKRCFTNDAVVLGEDKAHTGLAAIKAWKTAASAQYSYLAGPTELKKNDRTYIVKNRRALEAERVPWRAPPLRNGAPLTRHR